MVTSIRVDCDVPMKTRDGVTLRADIYRPDDSEKHPAIVVRTPYNKLLGHHNDRLSAVHAAFAGYAYIIQDTRGRFASEGEYTVAGPEGQDGYDTIEWVAAEHWCDGNVGMAGGSYLGRNQWHAAIEDPPHLKAISPAVVARGPISDTRLGGVVDLEQSISWFARMAIEMLNRMEKAGKDVTKARQMLDQARFNISELCNYLPLKDIPHFQFENMSEAFLVRMGGLLTPDINTEEDLYWPYHKVKVPCFHVGGWYDLFTGSTFANFLGMRENGGSALARQGQHVVCGPWAHSPSLLACVGGINFGQEATAAATLLMERHIAFFDRYLRGIEDRPIPTLRYFVMGRNRWQDADSWPLPETQWQRFFLRSKSRANSAAGDGSLSMAPPGSEPADIFVYDPRFPVPTLGGPFLDTGTLVPGPLEQTPVEKRNDVLCYTTQELKDELEVTGPLKLHLFASTSAKDTDFTAKLVDVHPDGTAYNVAQGCIRARYHKSLLKPELVNPGEVYEYIIDMAATSIAFGPGHRIRIDISSSDFPRIDRNMNTGNAFGEDAEGIPALQTIYHDGQYASYIDLPVIPARGS